MLCARWYKINCRFRLFRPTKRNLGDDLNPLLIKALSGQQPLWVPRYEDRTDQPVHQVIGSILHWATDNTIVWGCGFGSNDAELIGTPIKVCAVRGPLTRGRLLALGIPCPEVYGDPALLYPRFYRPNLPKKFKLGIIPHYTQTRHPLAIKLAKAEKSVCLIDVGKPVHQVIEQLVSCEVIAASSLHGLIFAHAYGIKALHISFPKEPSKYFKFHDYHQSVDLDYGGPLPVDDATTVAGLVRSAGQVPHQIRIDLEQLLDACPFASSGNTTLNLAV
jgi:pyruvyltransferase